MLFKINNDAVIRSAGPEDSELIHSLIYELAVYEKMTEQVTGTPEDTRRTLFEQNMAEVIICEYKGEPAGFALFFHNYSTFLAKSGLYLEDLFIKPEFRRKGLGKAMLSFLAKIAVERGCGRFEWSCLDWNEPSINFYKSLGAIAMDSWTVYRLTGDKLTDLAEKFKS